MIRKATLLLLLLACLTGAANADVTVTLSSPTNGSSTIDTTPTVVFTAAGNESAYTCELVVNGSTKATSNVTNNTLSALTSTALSEGLYSWYVNCTDTELIAGETGSGVYGLTIVYYLPYTATYTIADMTNITVDLMGTGLVALKPNVQNVVDLGVLGVIITMILGAAATIVSGVYVLVTKTKAAAKTTKF